MKNIIKPIIISILLFAVIAGVSAPAAASSGGDGMSKEKFDFNKNILISIFWPPTSEYINDEQYKYMADAEIDWVLGAGDGIGSKADQMKMLELCSKYGIGMCVGDDRFGGKLLDYKPSRIKKLVEEYKDIPGAYGYYMLDEPYNPNVFFEAYKALKEADPDGYMHLNFLPGHAYSTYEVYESQMNDWLKLCATTGHPQEYVMYDMYPFGLAQNSISRELMMKNLESVRKVGLANNVKTAMYIQSVCQQVSFRSPNREETLFEFNIGLAFGIKQFSYFTWFTPYNRGEPFDDGIITYTGIPNPKYEFICELDHMIHNVGKTLINLDAYGVYGSTNGYGAVDLLPDDFFLKINGRSDLTVSYMKDKSTGRNYCMIVNNFFNKKQNVKLEFTEDFDSLQYVSYEDGELHDFEKTGNTAEVSLDKGEAVILALPEGYDYSAKHVKVYEPGENLALDAQITCSSSEGANGWYMDNLNDGRRFAGATVNGWSSSSKDGLDTITVDLGKPLDLNRIDLYPAGAGEKFGQYMPDSFTVSVSGDGESWAPVAKASGLQIKDGSAPSLKFDKVNARYVRIEISKCTDNKSQLCEIEIYNDDGSVPGVEILPDGFEDLLANDTPDPVAYKKGSNLALNKKVAVSSFPNGGDYKTWGWWPDFLTDGNKNNGWTSDVKLHMSDKNVTEYAIIDLGDVFNIDKVEIFKNGCWPYDFTVEVSSDGKAFTEIAKETNSREPEVSYVVTPEGAHGRFVKIAGTKLRATDADGYMLQLGEVEVYGTPYIDRLAAENAVKLFTDNGGNENSASFKAFCDAFEKDTTTQKELDLLLQAMYNEIGLQVSEETETEEARTAAEYEFEYFTVEQTGEQTETETETEADPGPELTEPAETEPKKNKKSGIPETGIIIGAALVGAAALAASIIYAIRKRKNKTI